MPESSKHRSSHSHGHSHSHKHEHGHKKREDDPKAAQVVWEWYWSCCGCNNQAGLSTTYCFACPDCAHVRCKYCPMEPVKTIVCYWYLLRNTFPRTGTESWLIAIQGRTCRPTTCCNLVWYRGNFREKCADGDMEGVAVIPLLLFNSSQASHPLSEHYHFHVS